MDRFVWSGRNPESVVAFLGIALCSQVAATVYHKWFARSRRLKSQDVEVVIARYNEDISWISRLAETGVRICIYNKGSHLDVIELPPGICVTDLPNVGREGDSYAQHMFRRYDTLAEYTVFLQADPFVHSPHLMDILLNIPKHNKLWRRYQTLSLRHSEAIPPQNLVKESEKVREQSFSTHTLNSLEFHDEDSVSFYKDYIDFFSLPEGTNVSHHFLDSVGLGHLLPQNLLVAKFAFAALFGVPRNAIRRHPRGVYKKIIDLVDAHPCVGYVLERSWKVIFV